MVCIKNLDWPADLPESYFQPTTHELNRAYAGQVKAREALIDGPLLTKKLRDANERKEAQAKQARFPIVSDGHIKGSRLVSSLPRAFARLESESNLPTELRSNQALTPRAPSRLSTTSANLS